MAKPAMKKRAPQSGYVRLNMYASPGDVEAMRAVAWAQKRWRTWDCGEHDQPRSASTLLRDLLVHAMEEDRAPRRRR